MRWGGATAALPAIATLKALGVGKEPPTTIATNINVEVTGAGSPKETAKATADAIKRELSDSYYGRPPPWMYPANSQQ